MSGIKCFVADSRTEPDVDASLGAQILTVDKTFADLAESSTEEMRHPDPKKSHLRVVDSYDILPDAQTWGNTYYMVKFPERPAGSTAEVGPHRSSALTIGILEERKHITAGQGGDSTGPRR